MAQATEQVDLERQFNEQRDALFDEAADLDEDDANASTGLTVHGPRETVMDQTVEQETEQEQEAAPQVEQEQIQQVDLEPEQTYTQEELDELERQQLLADQQAVGRATRNYEQRTGKPLVDPKVAEARQKRRESVQEVRTTTPEIADAVEELVGDAREVIVEQVQERVEQALGQQEQKIHLESVFNAVQDAHDIYSDPRRFAALEDWIDHLPGFMSERFKRVIDNVDGDGDTDAVIGMLSDFTAYPDWREATERYLELEGQGGEIVTEPEQTQEQQVQERPQRRQARQALPAAALAVRSGSTRPLPTGDAGGAGKTEFERFYNDPEIIRLADQ